MPFLSPNQQRQSTERKISHPMDLLTPHTWGSPTVFWPLIAPGYLRGGLSCLLSALWCQYPMFLTLGQQYQSSEGLASMEVTLRGFVPVPNVMFSVLFHCFIVCLSCNPALLDNILPTPMAWYSLFVLKVLLNTSQPTNLGSIELGEGQKRTCPQQCGVERIANIDVCPKVSVCECL